MSRTRIIAVCIISFSVSILVIYELIRTTHVDIINYSNGHTDDMLDVQQALESYGSFQHRNGYSLRIEIRGLFDFGVDSLDKQGAFLEIYEYREPRWWVAWTQRFETLSSIPKHLAHSRILFVDFSDKSVYILAPDDNSFGHLLRHFNVKVDNVEQANRITNIFCKVGFIRESVVDIGECRCVDTNTFVTPISKNKQHVQDLVVRTTTEGIVRFVKVVKSSKSGLSHDNP